ncbi:MAG: nitroreductase family protein [Butyrivibrio sp.]|jgi:nitroreductase|nr:nitroreductase family protein [Butyrivibrio sp.]
MIRDLVQKNRSYRGYDESYHFTRDKLEEFVDCTRFCASSVNAQPLKYYIAWEKETVEKIQTLTHWAAALPQLELPHMGKHPTAFIVICQDLQIDSNQNRFQRDIGIAAQTILLAAVEQGLGGCMIGNFQAGDLKKALQLGAEIQPMLVVALGKPAEKIVLTEVGTDGSTAYYRDEEDVHYVPKRSLKSELLN